MQTRPSLVVRAAWRDGALLARLAFVDRATGAYAPFSPHGAVTANDGRFVRFARRGRARLRASLPRGRVRPARRRGLRAARRRPRGEVVRTTWPSWDDVDVRLDESLAALAGGGKVDVSVSAVRADGGGLVRPRRLRLRRRRRTANARRAPGAARRERPLRRSAREAGRRRAICARARTCSRNSPTGAARGSQRSSQCATRLHEAFGDVALPEEVERIRERLRNFEGIEEVEPPDVLVAPAARLSAPRFGLLVVLVVVPFRRHSRRRHGDREEPAVELPGPYPERVAAFRRSSGRRRGDERAGRDSRALPGVFRRESSRRSAFTFSDGASTICSDDHLWAVNSAVRKTPRPAPRVLPRTEIRPPL